MFSNLVVIGPSHCCDAGLPLAAIRAGETGLLDLGYCNDTAVQRAAISTLAEAAGTDGRWGLRWDTLSDPRRSVGSLPRLEEGRLYPIVVLASIPPGQMADAVRQARTIARHVCLEVSGVDEALSAQQAGCDSLIVKGHEAGGRVGPDTTFLLLQRLSGRLSIPFWVQGGLGPDTAAAAITAGAAGVVLCEQFWLTTDSPLSLGERQQWAALDGSESVLIDEGGLSFRLFSRTGPAALHVLAAERTAADGWHDWLDRQLRNADRTDPHLRVAVGQDVAFARFLAKQHATVAGVLEAYRHSLCDNAAIAQRLQPLGPDSPLAAALGTHYPILQGPMTRVSDTARFSASVAEHGALPFLALALMRRDEARELLAETKAQLGNRPWGVGILGFVPPELRKEQLEEVRRARPTHVIIAGGRPSQSRLLEDEGISTFLHVPSPRLLEMFVQEGARKFIFEGRECGGHVGPLSSFCLWQSVVDTLLALPLERPDELQIVFAGGIHDRLSAALVAVATARLAERGIKLGVLMGTAYLFTHEAVACGAITNEFQRQAIACRETALLQSALGHSIRCVNTPFAGEFQRIKEALTRQGVSAEEIRDKLESLNIGRLRIAAKGVTRRTPDEGYEEKGELCRIDAEGQFREGLYMIGQVALLRDQPVPMAALHADVSSGSVELLDERARPDETSATDAVTPTAFRDPQPAQRRQNGERDIAIVGMSCMFPKAPTLRQYWQNICNRVDAMIEVPRGRWNIDEFYSADRFTPDRIYTRYGAFLDDVRFDPVKWRMPPKTVEFIEPVQLLALEVAAAALADAGYATRPFSRERTGVVFAAAFGFHDLGISYGTRTMMRHFLPRNTGLPVDAVQHALHNLEQALPDWTEDSFPGLLMNVVAGRIARELDLNGPNFTVDAACASSLAALYTSVEQLRSGLADVMLTGAVDATNNPFCYMSFARTQALAPGGRSRPFDDSADGTALGEGIGCLVLKRRADAERDGDRIYALIKGIGGSSDGKHKSLTAPHPPGQSLALRRAYADAGVDPGTVSLIEAHGTGTAVGDAAEIDTLAEVFTDARRQSIAVGSVKSMIGHTKTAAGMASLIKTTLALDQRVLPPTIGVETPNRRNDFANGPLYINTESRPWFNSTPDVPLRAGLSAFGFGGTNFHVVLEEHRPAGRPPIERNLLPRPVELFAWRRAGRDGLLRDLQTLQQHLRDTPQADLASVAAAQCNDELLQGQAANTCRLTIVAESIDDLRQKLEQATVVVTQAGAGRRLENDIVYSEAALLTPDQICFLYPGQGSQSVNMLRDLVIAAPCAHGVFAEADEIAHAFLPQGISRSIYPAPTIGKTDNPARACDDLSDTRIAQPALAAVEVFATELLLRFGLQPARVAGHSFGEYVALWSAGAISRRDLLQFACQRGAVCASAAAESPGGMLAIAADESTVRRFLEDTPIAAHLANLNAPDQTVIAGSPAALLAATGELARRGIACRRLRVSTAFHTPQSSSAATSLVPFLSALPLRTPQRPVYSNTTGAQHSAEADAIRQLLARHLTEPVQFEREIRALYQDGIRLFLEVGPGKTLTDLASRILPRDSATALSLDGPADQPGWKSLARLLARCFVMGLPVDLEPWYQNRGLTALRTHAYFAQTRAENQGKSTDWIVSPGGNRPANPSPAVSSTTTLKTAVPPPPGALPTMSTFPVSPPANRNGVNQPAKSPVETLAFDSVSPTATPRVHMMPAPLYSGGNGSVPHPAETTPAEPQSPAALTQAPVPVTGDVLAQLQSTAQLLRDWQQSQNRVLEKFLDLQAQILTGRVSPEVASLHSFPWPSPGSERVGEMPLESRPQSMSPTTSSTAGPRQPAAPLRVRPAPVTGKAPVPMNGPPAAAPVQSASPVSPRTAPASLLPARNGSHGTIAPAAPPGENEPPPTEVFRHELLQFVSDRTGYPVEMLDESLPLESGLGIDSIKTLEIFSRLKKYHQYFRGENQDDEELLADFTRLKTLGDIVGRYDLQRQALAGGNRVQKQSEQKRAEQHTPIKRLVPTAVESPLPASAEQKKK